MHEQLEEKNASIVVNKGEEVSKTALETRPREYPEEDEVQGTESKADESNPTRTASNNLKQQDFKKLKATMKVLLQAEFLNSGELLKILKLFKKWILEGKVECKPSISRCL